MRSDRYASGITQRDERPHRKCGLAGFTREGLLAASEMLHDEARMDSLTWFHLVSSYTDVTVHECTLNNDPRRVAQFG